MVESLVIVVVLRNSQMNTVHDMCIVPKLDHRAKAPRSQGQEYEDCSDEEFKKMTDFVQEKIARLKTVAASKETQFEPVLNRRSYLPPKRKSKEEL